MNKTANFQRLNFPNIDAMRAEVLRYFEKHPDKKIEDTFVGEWATRPPFEELPTIRDFILPRVKTSITDVNISFISGHSNLDIHIDGTRYKIPQSDNPLFANQFALIIPISGYENTFNYWYDTTTVQPEDEVIQEIISSSYPYKHYGSTLRTGANLIPTDVICIDSPTIIRTNRYHNVVNQGYVPRLVVRIRFQETEWYDDPSSVFDYEDLI